MVTMPIAGALVDRIGPGKIVMTGVVLITAGMAAFTQVGTDTSYTLLLGALFVMGLGMGATMMPIMTSALQTLTDHNIARGSTLMNIVQQVAASIGTALFSVLLTNSYLDSKAITVMTAVSQAGDDQAKIGQILASAGVTPDQLQVLGAQALSDMADAFGSAFLVGTILVACVLIPAAFLPRRRITVDTDPEHTAAGHAHHTPMH